MNPNLYAFPQKLLAIETVLPADYEHATFVGRIWRPDVAGPSVVKLEKDLVLDVTASFPTVSSLLDRSEPAASLKAASGESLGPLTAILANSASGLIGSNMPSLLAPIDLQSIKAAGVTFAESMLERVIEERAKGDPDAAAGIRGQISEIIGGKLENLKPGSDDAYRLKDFLQEKGWWSQYLEVGIGKDAEIFTKSQPMSAVGHGALIGVHPESVWNNPEPEVVLAVSSSGSIVGATLGNDVNLRDFEGRSALLLGEAKDQNASCAVGPFIRLFDDNFTLDDVRAMDLHLRITGQDGFDLEGKSSMSKISRDPLNLVEQLMSHHQYPDGAVLFCGTLFAPTKDRDVPGRGFTHKTGDIVTISSDKLGALTNITVSTQTAPPWTFGAGSLMRNLAARGILRESQS